jgi:hypothetical protein
MYSIGKGFEYFRFPAGPAWGKAGPIEWRGCKINVISAWWLIQGEVYVV